MTEQVDEILKRHLIRNDGQEDLCFAIWFPSKGCTRQTFLLKEVILPRDGDRNVHGNVSFNSIYLNRALDAALKVGGGLAFLHSHPLGRGWQGMSRDDINAEKIIVPSAFGTTGFPLLGLTLGVQSQTWSARAWVRTGNNRHERFWCESVRVIGEGLSVDFYDPHIPSPPKRRSQVRTVSSWGEGVQDKIGRITVGVVGLGSVGSIIAEALARTGVNRVKLFDYQSFEEANQDRTLNSTLADVGKAKVEIAAKAYRGNATGINVEVEKIEYSICEEEGFRRALDCDVLFSCVDRPWGRGVLNFTAYAHLIPVIDGGIKVSKTAKGLLKGADWKAHLIGPGHKCLLCLKQYDPGLIAADQKGDLEDSRYIDCLPDDHPAKANENVFGFSMGVSSLEVNHFIMLLAKPIGLTNYGSQNYHLTTGEIELDREDCAPDCIFPSLTALGDTEVSGTGIHEPAAEARRKRKRRFNIFKLFF